MSESAPRYRLVHVRTLSFAERTGRLSDDPLEAPPLTYSPSFGLQLLEDERTIGVLIGIEALLLVTSPEGDESTVAPDTPPLAEVEVGCTFEFESLDPYRVDGRVQLPRQMAAQLVGIALSSARGVLSGRTVHPVFQTAPLPVISPLAIVGDVVEDLEWVAPAPAAPEG